MRRQMVGMSLSAIQQIDYVILPCDDLQAMKAFYLGAMQFQLEEDSENWIKFRIGSTYLTLRPRGQWRGWHDGDIPSASASVQLAFCVPYDDVDRCHNELVERGVTIVEPPKDQDFGHRTLFFRDPDENVLEIYAEL
jgi:glyoxylase I family protein